MYYVSVEAVYLDDPLVDWWALVMEFVLLHEKRLEFLGFSLLTTLTIRISKSKLGPMRPIA
jgi:hypothetical protein